MNSSYEYMMQLHVVIAHATLRQRGYISVNLLQINSVCRCQINSFEILLKIHLYSFTVTWSPQYLQNDVTFRK
ncbi:Uncharacterised protein [Chlamydia trachomatis]|nr:Uncharacterised protein [Chlamydia trachomatis]